MKVITKIGKIVLLTYITDINLYFYALKIYNSSAYTSDYYRFSIQINLNS